MLHTRDLFVLVALGLFEVVPLVFAHDHGSHSGETQDKEAPPMSNMSLPLNSTMLNPSHAAPQSYFDWLDFRGLMLAHIVLMVIAWFFVLPIGGYTLFHPWNRPY